MKVCQHLLVSQRGGSKSASKLRLIGSQILRLQVLKYANIPLSGEDWELAVLSAPSVPSPGMIVKNHFFLGYHHIEMNTSPAGHQPQVIKGYLLGDNHRNQDTGLKTGASDMCIGSPLGNLCSGALHRESGRTYPEKITVAF